MEVDTKNPPAKACTPIEISDEDIFQAMREISGYLDITPNDFKEVYLKAFQQAVKRLTRAVPVAKIMTRDVARVTIGTPLWDVAELLAKRRISGVPVVDENEKVIGVISNRDFVAALGREKKGSLMQVVADCLKGAVCLAAKVGNKRVEDLMTSPAVTVGPDTPVNDVANIMAQRGINRVPIVDSDQKLVGIVSRADIVSSTLVG